MMNHTDPWCMITDKMQSLVIPSGPRYVSDSFALQDLIDPFAVPKYDILVGHPKKGYPKNSIFPIVNLSTQVCICPQWSSDPTVYRMWPALIPACCVWSFSLPQCDPQIYVTRFMWPACCLKKFSSFMLSQKLCVPLFQIYGTLAMPKFKIHWTPTNYVHRSVNGPHRSHPKQFPDAWQSTVIPGGPRWLHVVPLLSQDAILCVIPLLSPFLISLLSKNVLLLVSPNVSPLLSWTVILLSHCDPQRSPCCPNSVVLSVGTERVVNHDSHLQTDFVAWYRRRDLFCGVTCASVGVTWYQYHRMFPVQLMWIHEIFWSQSESLHDRSWCNLSYPGRGSPQGAGTMVRTKWAANSIPYSPNLFAWNLGSGRASQRCCLFCCSSMPVKVPKAGNFPGTSVCHFSTCRQPSKAVALCFIQNSQQRIESRFPNEVQKSSLFLDHVNSCNTSTRQMSGARRLVSVSVGPKQNKNT